jgi:GTPase SAR1 family protein
MPNNSSDTDNLLSQQDWLSCAAVGLAQIDVAVQGQIDCLAETLQAAKLARSTCSAYSDLHALGMDVRKLRQRFKSQSVRIGVIGEFSTGKSTLVNALLGVSILESDVVQGTTAFPIRIGYAQKLSGSLDLFDGKKIDFHPKGLADCGGDLDRAIAKVDSVDAISHATFALPIPSLQGIELIDTPGLDSSSELHFAKTMHAVSSFCDAFVVATSAVRPVTENLVAFLMQYLNTKLSRCIFVVTQIDLLKSHREIELVVENVSSRLASALTLRDAPVVVGCSAESVLYDVDTGRRRSRTSRPSREQLRTDFINLRRQLTEHAKVNHFAILKESTEELVRSFVSLLDPMIDAPLGVIGYHDELDGCAKVGTIRKKGMTLHKRLSERAANDTAKCRLGCLAEIKRSFDFLKDRLRAELAKPNSMDDIAAWAKRSPPQEIGRCATASSGLVRSAIHQLMQDFGELDKQFVVELNRQFYSFNISVSDSPMDVQVDCNQIATRTTQSLTSVSSTNEWSGSEVTGAAAGAGVGFMVFGPIGAVVGGMIGRGVGGLFDKRAEVLKAEVEGKMMQSIEQASQLICDQCKDSIQSVFEYWQKHQIGCFEQALKTYGEMLDRLKAARPDTVKLESAACRYLTNTLEIAQRLSFELD